MTGNTEHPEVTIVQAVPAVIDLAYYNAIPPAWPGPPRPDDGSDDAPVIIAARTCSVDGRRCDGSFGDLPNAPDWEVFFDIDGTNIRVGMSAEAATQFGMQLLTSAAQATARRQNPQVHD